MMRTTVAFIGMITVLVLIALAFRRKALQPEFRPLLESGQKFNLNLLTLIWAWFRKNDDPLKPLHKRIARIGFAYFVALLASTLLIVPAATILIFDALGID